MGAVDQSVVALSDFFLVGSHSAGQSKGFRPVETTDTGARTVAMTNDDDELIPVLDPAQDAFEIHSWPFYHLARVTSIYAQRMDASLKPIGIDVPRWRVLTLLQKNGASTVTQLSQEAVSKISTMAKIVQRMTAEGLISVRTSDDDARSTEVTISSRGREILENVQAKVSRIGRRAFDGISPDDLRRINEICERLYDNLSH